MDTLINWRIQMKFRKLLVQYLQVLILGLLRLCGIGVESKDAGSSGSDSGKQKSLVFQSSHKKKLATVLELMKINH